MLLSLWYLFKIIAVIGVTVFLASQSGSVNVTWQDYNITIQLGIVAAVLFLSFWIIFIASGIAARISFWPREIMRARREKQHIKGYKALLQSLTAAAIGDQKTAFSMAKLAQKLLPDAESGLPLLLQAQSQPVTDGNYEQVYLTLLQNADTALLGLQGMTQKAILAGDFEKALLLVRQSVEKFPKNTSLLKTLYDLEVRNQQWNAALLTLKRAQKAKIISKDEATKDRCTIYVVLGDLALAAKREDEALSFYKMAMAEGREDFIPAVTRLACLYQQQGLIKKSISVIEKAWSRAAHPALAKLWANLWADYAQPKNMAHFLWTKKLVGERPQSLVSFLALANTAIEDGLWGEARAALVSAEKISACPEVYNTWVKLEKKSQGSAEAIQQWMDRSRQAEINGAGCGAWVCSKTGRSFAEWVAVIEPEKLFNSLEWDANAYPNPNGKFTKMISSATA